MIVFDRVAKRYPNGREALAGVTLRVHPGEMVFLTGKSGAGKSTVLKLIALLERPTRGSVLIAWVRPRKTPSRLVSRVRCFNSSGEPSATRLP